MLKVEHTTRAYSGKPGCMCGCNGNYNKGERARKLAITQMLKDPRVHLQTWNDNQEGCLYLVKAARNRVLYLNQEGVSVALALGVKQETN